MSRGASLPQFPSGLHAGGGVSPGANLAASARKVFAGGNKTVVWVSKTYELMPDVPMFPQLASEQHAKRIASGENHEGEAPHQATCYQDTHQSDDSQRWCLVRQSCGLNKDSRR